MQIPALNAVTKPPSRSELRKARERGEATIEVEGVKFPTGLVPVIRTDADGQAINPEAADSVTPEVPATEEVSAPTMPAAELPLPAQSLQPTAYSPLPEVAAEASYNPATPLQPEDSYRPADSYQPQASYSPAVSPQPAQSYQPQASYNPAASLQPADSYQPPASYNPADSYQPQASYNPAASLQPEDSYRPTDSYQPQASYNPADSYQPPAAQAEVAPERAEEWFEDDDFDLDGLGDGPDMADFEGESTFDQSQGGSN